MHALSVPCATPKPSEYLSRGEIGRGCIVSLAKQTESDDTRASARARHHEIPHLNLLQKFSKGYG